MLIHFFTPNNVSHTSSFYQIFLLDIQQFHSRRYRRKKSVSQRERTQIEDKVVQTDRRLPFSSKTEIRPNEFSSRVFFFIRFKYLWAIKLNYKSCPFITHLSVFTTKRIEEKIALHEPLLTTDIFPNTEHVFGC